MDKQTVRHPQIIANEIKKEKYMCVAALESSLTILQKLSTEVPHDTAISFLGIYPREMRTCLHKHSLQHYS